MDGRRRPTNEELLDRNARLAVRLGQLAVRWHRDHGHSGTVQQCQHDVCVKTVAVLERNAVPDA